MPAPVAIVIEAKRQIRRLLRGVLEGKGWQVFTADTLHRGLVDAGTRKCNLLSQVRANLPRPPPAQASCKDLVFCFGTAMTDRAARLVRRAGCKVDLTSIDHRLVP